MNAIGTCVRCKTQKARESFYPNKLTKSGLSSYCIECNREYQRSWRKQNPGYMRRYLERHPERAKREQERKRNRVLSPEQKARSLEMKRNSYRNDGGKKLARQKLHAAELTDYYVASSMGLKKSQCTPELLAMKREQLLARRLARQLKKAADESSKDPS